MIYSNKKIAISNIIRNIQMICGVTSSLTGFMGFFATVGHMDSMDVGLIIFFLAIGGLLIWRSLVRKHFIKLARTYYIRLSDASNGSITDLADSLEKPRNLVLNDLQKLIDTGYLTDAFIDLANNCIIFRKGFNQNLINNPASTGFTVAVCKSCGASNKIQKGTIGKCEYCGNAIQ